jgi:anaerobic ribonucleoside-triphosphate reductase
MAQCNCTCEVYSRVVGYLLPVQNWNAGKQEEFKERVVYSIEKALEATKAA